MQKKFVSFGIVVFSVCVFSGVSFWFHSPQKFLNIFFKQRFSQITRTAADFLLLPQDSGTSFSFPVGKQFMVILNDQTYPRDGWKIICTPTNILHKSGEALFLIPPLYGVKYESTQQGVCTVKNTSFSVTVHLVNSPS